MSVDTRRLPAPKSSKHPCDFSDLTATDIVKHFVHV